MIPRLHIVSGLIASILIFIAYPKVNLFYLSLFFLSSFLIDFDHYMCAAVKLGKLNLKNALKYYKRMQEIEENEARRGIFRKGHFHIFHTIEFHALVLALGFIHPMFMYVFAGMVFHSAVDFAWMAHRRRLYRREFFFNNWLMKKIC